MLIVINIMIIMQAKCDLTKFINVFILEILFTAALSKITLNGNSIKMSDVEKLKVAAPSVVVHFELASKATTSRS